MLIQITLLDPFIPASLADNIRPNSSLSVAAMSALKDFEGNQRLVQLDNYWSFGTPGTYNTFNWRVSDIPGFEIDWVNLPNPFVHYLGHTAPIQFYADTVAASVPGASVAPDLEPFDLSRYGWSQSLFFNEPIVDQQPQSQPVNAGQSATFTIHSNTRHAQFDNADAAGLTVQWQKDGVDLPGETSTTLTIANATAASAGEYIAVVSNAAGRTKSTAAVLTVNGGGGSGPTITQQPQDQPVVVGQTATFTVVATGSGSLTYQWKRNGLDISGATAASYTTSTVSLIHDGYTYQVVVTDSQGFKASRVATLNVTGATGSCSDPNEPNDPHPPPHRSPSVSPPMVTFAPLLTWTGSASSSRPTAC